ncbi:hypothetical protein D3C72_2460140 [compost metagenome]
MLGSGNHARRIAARPGADVREAFGRVDQVGKGALRLQIVPAGVGFVSLDVDAQGCARRARTREAEDDA